MKLILRDRKQELVDQWKIAFRGVADVEVGCGDIFDVPADAIVSPANSFGFMNGGIDLVYSNRFGWDLENSLQKYLSVNWDGELPIGNAVVIPIDKKDEPYKWLVSAPTMRVPMDITGTVNAYLAMRAVLRAVRKHNAAVEREQVMVGDYGHGGLKSTMIETVLCPGLGTAIGRLPSNVAAHQMRRAWKTVMEKVQLPAGNLAASFHGHECMRRGLPYEGEDF